MNQPNHRSEIQQREQIQNRSRVSDKKQAKKHRKHGSKRTSDKQQSSSSTHGKDKPIHGSGMRKALEEADRRIFSGGLTREGQPAINSKKDGKKADKHKQSSKGTLAREGIHPAIINPVAHAANKHATKKVTDALSGGIAERMTTRRTQAVEKTATQKHGKADSRAAPPTKSAKDEKRHATGKKSDDKKTATSKNTTGKKEHKRKK
jgi:hypothetical protein